LPNDVKEPDSGGNDDDPAGLDHSPHPPPVGLLTTRVVKAGTYVPAHSVPGVICRVGINSCATVIRSALIRSTKAGLTSIVDVQRSGVLTSSGVPNGVGLETGYPAGLEGLKS
jgi:hypothetical protein